jgi:hypothetical protein
MGCLWRALRATLLLVVGGIALIVGLGYVAAACAVRHTEKAWADSYESMEAFAARLPAQPDSPAARSLDQMTRPLGIRMFWTHEVAADEKEAREKETHEKALPVIVQMINTCGVRGADQCSPPSPEGAAFLQDEASHLRAIETQILEGGPLRWEQDLSKGFSGPIPYLVGHRQLQSLLLARAVMAADRDPQQAERSLEASWVLNGSLAERSALICRLMTVAVCGLQQGVLRTMKRPPDRWRPRMQQRTFATDLQLPYQSEAWGWRRFTAGTWGVFDLSSMESGETPPYSVLGTAGRILTAPYVRLSFAGASEALLRATEELRSKRRCDFDVAGYSQEVEESFPWWNTIGRVATPSLVSAWAALRRADLDRELTERVFLARDEHRATGRWPAAPVTSTVCEGLVWEQEPAADGTVTIRAREKPFPNDEPKSQWSIRLHP